MITELLEDPQTTILYSDPGADLRIELVQGFPAAIDSLLQQTVWGTGDVLYKVDGMGASLRKLPSARYLLLKKNNQLAAMHFVLPKEPSGPAHNWNSFYSSILIVDLKYRGYGYGKLLKQESLRHLEKTGGAKWMNYAYIEELNVRSIKISETLGVHSVGQFHAMTYSRLFPKSSPHVSRLMPSQRALMRDLLTERYRQHILTDFELSLKPDQYWVYVKDGQILAGVQTDHQRWVIQSLSGVGGWLAMRALPRLPLIRDLFNPRDFRFLKISHLYFQSGHAAEAQELIQTVLTQHQMKTALTYMDKRSPVYQEFVAAGPLGLLNALTETPARLMAFFHGFQKDEIENISRQPACISPIDY